MKNTDNTLARSNRDLGIDHQRPTAAEHTTPLATLPALTQEDIGYLEQREKVITNTDKPAKRTKRIKRTKRTKRIKRIKRITRITRITRVTRPTSEAQTAAFDELDRLGDVLAKLPESQRFNAPLHEIGALIRQDPADMGNETMTDDPSGAPTSSVSLCPDCGAKPGEMHKGACDVELCPYCGNSMSGCDCYVKWRPRIPWDGEWPGKKECREFDFWCLWPGVPCDRSHPDASEDLNRLSMECEWDVDARRWVIRKPDRKRYMDARLFHQVLHPGGDYDEWLAATAAAHPADIIDSDDCEDARISLKLAEDFACHGKGDTGTRAYNLIFDAYYCEGGDSGTIAGVLFSRYAEALEAGSGVTVRPGSRAYYSYGS